MYPPTCNQAVGLSPRVRGNRGSTESGTELTGSIPACAGEPVLVAPGVIPVGVYPRVCGGTGLFIVSQM